MMRLKFVFCIFLLKLVVSPYASAQDIRFGSGVDSAYMMIGDQRKFTFQVEGGRGLKIDFPLLKDTLTRGIEIVSGPVRDSLKGKNGIWTYRQTYVVTSFDTGVYVIPSFPIKIMGEGFNKTLRTDPVRIDVHTYEVDVDKEYRDIIAPKSVPLRFWDIFKWILWGVLFVGAVVGVVWYLNYKRKGRSIFETLRPVVPPYESALKALEMIREKKEWIKGKEKSYYTELTDTVRQYLAGELGISAMEQTSFETLKAMEKSVFISKEDRESVGEVFDTADLVKFAKYTPLTDESAGYLEDVARFLDRTHQKVEEILNAEEKNADAAAGSGEKPGNLS